MKRTIFPCDSKGRILKGFCPTVCNSESDFSKTLFGWLRFSQKFGIKFYFNGVKVVSLL